MAAENAGKDRAGRKCPGGGPRHLARVGIGCLACRLRLESWDPAASEGAERGLLHATRSGAHKAAKTLLRSSRPAVMALPPLDCPAEENPGVGRAGYGNGFRSILRCKRFICPPPGPQTTDIQIGSRKPSPCRDSVLLVCKNQHRGAHPAGYAHSTPGVRADRRLSGGIL